MERIPMDPANRGIARGAAGRVAVVHNADVAIVLTALGIPRPRPGEWSVKVGGAMARHQVLSLGALNLLYFAARPQGEPGQSGA
jgi:hypothetical protein